MLGRIRKKGARSWITSSPNGAESWVVRRIEDKATQKPQTYCVVRATTLENTHLPAEYIEDLLDSYTTDHARQELYGERVDLSGRLMSRTWIKTQAVPADNEGYVLGVDLAISQRDTADDRAIVVLTKRGDTLYVVDTATGKWGFYDTQQRIAEMAAKWNAHTIAVENVAYQQAMVEELRRTTNFNIRGVNPRGQNKKTRFFPVAGKYEHGYIVHDEAANLTQLEDELAAFDGQGKYPDNLIDALIYAVDACSTQRVEMFLL